MSPFGRPALAAIARQVERELGALRQAFANPPFSAIAPAVRAAMAAYVLRDGKRLRPILFVLSYRGYAPKPARNLYKSAAALEVLHDFMLVHDDLVDHAQTRRGGPALHVQLEDLLAGQPAARFSGSEAALLVGDLLYALGLDMFLSVAERPERKLRAMACLTQSAVFTACGELKELLDTLGPAAGTTAAGIAQTCQWKTAYYSFVCPLVTGATLGGAPAADLRTLKRCALLLGLAFQIRDDIEDLMHDARTPGAAPELSDLREGKVTLPLWYALRHGSTDDAVRLRTVLDAGTQTPRACRAARRIIFRSGGVDYAKAEIVRHAGTAWRLLETLDMAPASRVLLRSYLGQLLLLPGAEADGVCTVAAGAA